MTSPLSLALFKAMSTYDDEVRKAKAPALAPRAFDDATASR
ncbi:hypothetical protein SAMN05216287_1595 [Pseudomonas kuykendallii]|uniref:Uncharacterized protein n=1 Tax=Pseudomonas kuykendallii TaxID=1007099 RepID=A0A1H2WM42_9PSED|nr:hypothetical protein SAMN05216287_1595 [Pseudomonas kuykendallii]